jgi:acyl-CoA hydrolase
MKPSAPACFSDAETCVDQVIATVGRDIVLGLPLGIGKPCHFVNALYRRAVEDSSLRLRIATALTIERPTPASDLERRFLEPFLERVFGDYPTLEYLPAVRRNSLPPNVGMTEFFLSPGKYLNNALEQQNYISSNYTHIARDMMDLGVNVCGQLVSKATVAGEIRLSLSSNPDLTLDLIRMMRRQASPEHPTAAVAQVNNNLPFMVHDALVEPSDFDMVIDNPAYEYQLFGPPNAAVNTTDYMIGLYASALIRDGGTLQIGIGSLGDAIVYATLVRHRENETYQRILAETGVLARFGETVQTVGGTGDFEKGLYGSSEMFVSGFMELYKAGILKREVYAEPAIQRLVNEGKLGREFGPEVLDLFVSEGVVGEDLTAGDLDFLQRVGVVKPEVVFGNGKLCLPTGEQIPADLTGASNREDIAARCLGRELAGGVVMHGGFFMGPGRSTTGCAIWMSKNARSSPWPASCT